jgi:hypothetical protein
MPTRSGWLLLPVSALALALAGCGSGQAAPAAIDPASAVLSPSDLPRGYRTGDDGSCGPMIPTAEKRWPALDPIFLQAQAQACVVELRRTSASPAIGPAAVWSAAFVFEELRDARRLFAARAELVRMTAHLKPSTSTPLDLGDEAALLRSEAVYGRGAAVVWRSGTVVAVLGTEPGWDQPVDVAATRAFASRQQALIANPAAKTAPVDETEIVLDDPTLHLPVYWLGRTFALGGGLPGLTLRSVPVVSTHPGEGPGNKVELPYRAAEPGTPGVTLSLWEPVRWERFIKTRLGRLIWDSPCSRRWIVKVADGRAEIFAGYGTSSPLSRPCPSRPPDRVIAHVYLPGVVVAVNLPYGYCCAGRFSRGPDPYDTRAGMIAVVRALQPRPTKR